MYKMRRCISFSHGHNFQLVYSKDKMESLHKCSNFLLTLVIHNMQTPYNTCKLFVYVFQMYLPVSTKASLVGLKDINT
jgi:hypothetical protein